MIIFHFLGSHESGRRTRDYCLDYLYSRNVCKSRGWSLLLEENQCFSPVLLIILRTYLISLGNTNTLYTTIFFPSAMKRLHSRLVW